MQKRGFIVISNYCKFVSNNFIKIYDYLWFSIIIPWLVLVTRAYKTFIINKFYNIHDWW